MKVLKILPLAALIGDLFLVDACEDKKKGFSRELVEPETDSTMYVRLDAHTDDSIRVTPLDGGHARTFGIAEARLNNTIHGTLTDGDTLAVIPRFADRRIASAVNCTEIAGLWLYDDGSGNGMRLKSNGTAGSVGDAGRYALRSWKIHNGAFLLTYILADGTDYRETADTAHIELLSADTFTFTLADSTVCCHRVEGVINR